MISIIYEIQSIDQIVFKMYEKILRHEAYKFLGLLNMNCGKCFMPKMRRASPLVFGGCSHIQIKILLLYLYTMLR